MEFVYQGVNKAKQMGFSMWLYDERGNPTETPGPCFKRHPEWEALDW
jgi:hypothetical protein